jgi:hypothetical protein
VLAQQLTDPREASLADGEYVVSVAPGFNASDALVEQLIAALREREADVAIASPFARGGRLRGPSWLARMATSWVNGFLSLAAHGDVATVVGTVRAFRREMLTRVLASCAGVDLDSEVVLEARRQGARIVEVPVVLERTKGSDRFTIRVLVAASSRLWAQLRTGLHYRPALWLALPGLVPGVLPLVVALLLVAHATPAQLALWTLVTLVVQYGSLAILSWQTSSFVVKRWLRRGSA